MFNLQRLSLATVLVAGLLTGCGQSAVPGMSASKAHQSVQASARGLLIGEGNKVELLVDGPAIFESMNAAIAAAQHSVQLHAFQLGGDTGMRLVNNLIERHKAGVKVQVLIDPNHGGGGSGKAMMLRCMTALTEAGVPMRDYHMKGMPKGPTWLSNLATLDHSKIVVVDGHTAFVGGMNFYDHGALNHDYMVKIQGPSATQVGEMSNADWRHSGGSEGLIDLPKAGPMGTSRVEIAQTSPSANNIRSVITRYIDQAQKKVYVEVLFLDDDMILDALVGAKQRGVDVRVILDPIDWGSHVPELDRLPFNGIPNWAAVKGLMDAEIPVYWYTPKGPHNNLHAKTAMIDGRYLLVGSPNFTYRALDRNRETLAAVEAPELAAQFEQTFLQDEASSERIKGLSTWQRRLAGWFDRIKRGIYNPKTMPQPPAK